MHGISGSSQDPVVVHVAESLNRAGIGALRFDFNGHGRSEGNSADMTVPNEIEDARAVLAFAGLDVVSVVGLAGHSQGGVVTGMVAGESGADVPALALLAPAGVLRENTVAGDVLGVRIDPADPPESVTPFDGFTIGREYMVTAQTLPVYETSARYRGPVCIVQGEDDDVVPPATAERYRDGYAQVELHLLPGQGHGFEHDPDEAARVVADFFVRTLPAAP